MVSCLSSGLAKNDKITSMFVLLSRLFHYFESLAFSKMEGETNLTSKQPDRIFLVKFSKVQQLSNNFSKNPAILTKS